LDDFVFFCFFIGNDFLPSLNTLDIDEGSLTLIFKFYSKSLLENEGYITDKGKIDFKRAEKIFAQLAKNELESLCRMLKKLEKTCNERLEKKTKALNDQKNLLKKKKINNKKTHFLFNLKKEMSTAELLKYKKDKIKNKLNNYKLEYSSLMDKLGKKEYKFEDDVNDFSKKEISKMIEKFQKNVDSVEDTEMTEFISDTNQEVKETQRKNLFDNINKELNEKLQSQNNEKEGNLGSFFDSEGEGKEKKRYRMRDTRDNKDPNNRANINDPERTSEDERQRCLKKASKFLNYIKDDNYCSDMNIEDISEGELGPVSDIEIMISPEANLEHYDEYQDMEKVFQQKLIEYYIKDVNEAKKFYYKVKKIINSKGKSENRS
jgi:5'-3' exonuclease